MPIPAGMDVYFEVYTPTASNNQSFGVCNASCRLTTAELGNGDANGWGVLWTGTTTGGTKWNNTSGSFTLPSTPAANDVWMFAVQRSTNKMWVGLNGSWVGTVGTSGEVFNTLASTGDLFPATLTYNTQPSFNFGQRPFTYTPPTGFKALSQANLPTPAILNPKKHFDVGLVTGSASVDQTITTDFAPDFVWSKSRNNVLEHALYAKQIGGDKYLSSNATTAETTTVSNVVTFNSTGVSLKAGGSLINDATRTYVDWLWKAGGAAVTNTSGTITSQVSANVEAGFSIVTYTGNTTPSVQTVGHGLNKAPTLMIVRNRDIADNWAVYHSALGATKGINLNLTNAAFTWNRYWNDTAPTSSVFTVGGSTPDPQVNQNNAKHIAYCFTDSSIIKVGSYTGNGSSDGVYVHCGLKPRFLLIKKTDSVSIAGGVWTMVDTARSTYNMANEMVRSESSVAETSTAEIDVLSNGFKYRGSSANTLYDHNINGANYIFIAIADVTGRYSNAR
jgi:hypothetical protein